MINQDKLLTIAVILAIIAACLGVVYENEILLAAVNVMLVAALIAFTYSYAKHTKDLVDKAEAQRQVMMEGQVNDIAPLIELRLASIDTPSPGAYTIIEYRNVGRGVAFKVRVWIEFGEGPLYRSKAFFVQLVPSDGQWRQTASILGEIQDDSRATISPLVKAQYHGTYGEQRTYESFLVFPTNTPPILEFGKVETPIPITELRWHSMEQSTTGDDFL